MFVEKLLKKLCDSTPNWYEDNYDADRFGPIKKWSKRTIREALCKKFNFLQLRGPRHVGLQMIPHLSGIGRTWELLADETSKNLLVDIMAYRLLGHNKVKLPTNTPEYHETLEELNRKAAESSEKIKTDFMHFELSRMTIDIEGEDVDLFIRPPAYMAQIFSKQYRYESEEVNIGVEEGDVVIDCGGCWGETAVFFASQAGDTGRVFSFEFVPSNLEIFRKNKALNKEVTKNLTVVEHPVWSTSGGKLFYQDNGPGSTVRPNDFKGSTGSVTVMSIDDLAKESAIEKVSFIKMDIEGAELESLKGAAETIKKDKPKMAISLYHSLADFHEIPEFIDGLDLGYKFYLRHATIHAEETVLFAVVS